MAKVVSQETYDGVVLENVVDFEMSCEEAHAEAQKEFEAQVCVGRQERRHFVLVWVCMCTRNHSTNFLTILESCIYI